MAEAGQLIRAFIAINLPPQLRAKLAAVQQALQRAPGGQAVRWTAAGQIHLTLRFLGNVPAESVAEIQATLPQACAGIAPFDLQAGGLGCFPNPRQPRIIWVGLTGELEALRHLQDQVERATAPWGEPEARQFHPHLTIGRVKPEQAKPARPLAEVLQARPAEPLGTWRVQQVDLMQSRLAPGGAEYSLLNSLALTGAPAA